MKSKNIFLGVIIGAVLILSFQFQKEKESYNKLPLSDFTRSFISIDSSLIALVNAKVIDGTGIPAKDSQTILIKNGKIVEVGPTQAINIPQGYHRMNLLGKTIIPGIVGTHNHMRLPRSAMFYTAPKLYLAAGVTTIQTCGTGNPREEITIKKSIQQGDQPGPEIVNSSPYFTGPDGKSNFIRFLDEEVIRDTIAYWANEGVEWFKVYRNTRPKDLKVIIEEAHKHNAKVTGHLCATTYEEAAKLGIDAIEHGFIHSYDHAEGKQVDSCSGSRNFRTEIDIMGKEVEQVHQTLIKNGVALSSTLSIFEAQARGLADQRDLDAMAAIHEEAYQHRRKRKEELGKDWYFKEEWLLKSMQYDLAFFRRGGLLVAGPDPGLHNMPGYGDQKNYELFIEAGFKPEEAIQVMTSNGAKLLERDSIGTIQKGKIANLVVLNGDLENQPNIIRKVEIVFKDGIGYDPKKLIKAVEGNVGSENDDRMTYFGQKAPTDKPEVFAPNIISKPDRHEFGCAFSKNSREFFFGVENGIYPEMFYSKLEKGVWSTPNKLFKNDKFSSNDPMLSPDENKLYFISDRPITEGGTSKDIDIWYVQREGDTWSSPINAGKNINSNLNEYFISFSEEGRMYFSSNIEAPEEEDFDFDIFYADPKEDGFDKPVKLGENINTEWYEADVFIAPDESYIIFCAMRADGFGRGDLYISFKDENGNWTPSKNMGPNINSENHELCPFVSADGKYFFYTSNGDIYWVSFEVIEEFR